MENPDQSSRLFWLHQLIVSEHTGRSLAAKQRKMQNAHLEMGKPVLGKEVKSSHLMSTTPVKDASQRVVTRLARLRVDPHHDPTLAKLHQAKASHL